jgi:lipopolysaccharide cholinephosphotransferase
MKKAWAVQLEMLDCIMSIARKHNIPLWADYGTLLGAVRHQGFVPWDDDIDLCMFRKDYMAFPAILKEELPSHYKISSFYTTADYDQPNIFVGNRHNLDIGNSQQ